MCSVPLDGFEGRFIALLGRADADPEVREIARMLHGALESALQTEQWGLLDDALRSAHQRLGVRGLTPASRRELAEALEMSAVVTLEIPERDRVHAVLANRLADSPASSSPEATPMGALGAAYVDRLLQGDRRGAVALTRHAVSDGMDMLAILLDILEPAQYEVGRLWALGRISIAQEHFCTAVTQFVMTDLYPGFFTGEESRRRLVAVHVPGSTHHVGLRMVTDVLECRDWSTTYISEDLTNEALSALVAEDQADLLLISASMAGHIKLVTSMIRAIRDDPRTRDVKVVVGGRPFSVAPDLVEAVGADGWARDARSAVEICNKLVGGAG